MGKDQEQELMVDLSAQWVLSFSWPQKDKMRTLAKMYY
jgi:hypothetical protein